MNNRFRFVDLFCGGGGSITGAIDALNAAGLPYEGRGFNHWPIAIKTIELNHPEIIPDFARACTPIEAVVPDEIFPDEPRRIDVIWASPSCTHHSVAAGGIPRSNQLRSQPEHIIPYLRLTKCRRLYLENVKELRSWGPLLDDDTRIKGKLYKAGQPDPRKAGKYFDLLMQEIRASGYKVDMQIMNAADYGAATSRERLIVQAVRRSSGEKILWPEPTHSRTPDLFGCKPWRSAAEIIDWTIPGESIFDRKKPLCEKTLRRIEAGIKKYWGAWAEPFLVILRGTNDDQIANSAVPLTAPLPAITTSGAHFALISPVWLDLAHTKTGGVSGTVNDPLNTITCSHGTHAVIQPFITRYNGGDNRNHSASEPLPVIDTSNRYGVISPLFVPQHGGGTVKPCEAPLSTIATTGSIGVVTPFLVDYHGMGETQPLDKPMNTIRTHDRFGLIEGRILTLPDGQKYKLDITHRMLTAKELAAATGFPAGYRFFGGDTAAKKQIGNAVCPDLAAALYRAFLAA
jgi:DNA (cytosine-5)-methyltransferase 1